MQNKRPRPQAIDNFIPSGRSLNGLRPRSQRQRFPDVGMTMSPYRNGTLSLASTLEPTVSSPKKKRRKWHWTKKRIIFACLLPFLLIGLWLGIKFGFNAARIFNGNLFNVFTTTRLKGEDQGRVNILLAGNSADDVGHDGGELTDSIMILSLDTKNNKAFILSVPRDLYVPIQDNGSAKINTAYVYGKQQKFNESGYPKGGMGLLEKTIQSNLGITTHYYALINYSALRDAVNAVGGVPVTINSGSACGLYDPSIDWTTHGPLVDLSNGTHTLSGQQALNLARARGDARGSCGYAKSDYMRTQNQRMLLLSLKNKVFTTGVLANPIKLSKLFDSLGRNVKTDMQLSEVRRLNDLIKGVDNGKIKSYGLEDINGKSYLTSYRTASGQSALVPTAGVDNFSEIKSVLRRLMSTNKVAQEEAKVVLLNGTDTYGLAMKNKSLLENRNITVTNVADATTTASSTYIISTANTSKTATLAALKTLYGTRVTTANPYATLYKDADFIVVLGQDQVAVATAQ
jgi:LCP family protein required for cell wall assembly